MRTRWSAPPRRVAVPVIGALGVALLASGPAPWVRARTWTALAEVGVTVTGSRAAPVVAASGVLVLAAALAMAVARRRAVLVAALMVVVGALLATGGAVTVLVNPLAVAEAGAQRAVGVGAGVTDVGTTVVPWLVVVVAVLIGLAGVGAGRASRAWPTGTRHEVPSRAAPRDDWEALTIGEDPTDDGSPGG